MSFIQTISLFDICLIMAFTLRGFMGYREFRKPTFVMGVIEGAYMVFLGTGAATAVSIGWQVLKAY